MTEAFIPSIHTPENRDAQIVNIFSEYPETFLIGSVGRAAVLGEPLPVNKSLGRQVRDVDITHGSESGIDIDPEAMTPFPVDVALDGLIKVAPGRPYATILFDNRRPDVSVELPATVFEPYPIRVGAETVSTLHPDTLRHLHLICGRPKDVLNAARFARRLLGTCYPRLPEEYFSPLFELQQMVLKDPSLRTQRRVEQLSALYAMVPSAIRQYTSPPLRKVKHKLITAERKHVSGMPSL